MKILSLKAENVKRLKAVEIHPDGSLVVVGGRNAQGKSSVLDAITMALGGAASFCERPVRDGAKGARIEIDLGDIEVVRTFDDKGGSKLTVRGKDGNIKASPQALLDALAGRMSFDPLTFSRMDRKRQLETLRKLVGVDTSSLDARYKTLFDERTATGRDTESVRARVEAMPHHADAPAEEVSVLDLSAELERAKDNNRKLVQNKAELDAATAYKTALRERAVRVRDGHEKTPEMQAACDAKDENLRQAKALRSEIEEVKARLMRLHAELDVHERRSVDLERAWDSARINAGDAADDECRAAEKRCGDLAESLIGMRTVDLEPIVAQIRSIEDTNRKVRENQNRRDHQRDVERCRARWDELTDQLDALEKEKRAAIAAAAFPVEGLSFDAEGVLFNSVPFTQASAAEQLRVSVAMGLALNPTLRVVLIRDGSLLDDDGLRLVAEMAAQRDAQVWVERVGHGEEVSVVIEDGSVVDVHVGTQAEV